MASRTDAAGPGKAGDLTYAALAVVIAFSLATARLIVWPAEGAPARADAIVMLAGRATVSPRH